jgi:hypothetical protein
MMRLIMEEGYLDYHWQTMLLDSEGENAGILNNDA